MGFRTLNAAMNKLIINNNCNSQLTLQLRKTLTLSSPTLFLVNFFIFPCLLRPALACLVSHCIFSCPSSVTSCPLLKAVHSVLSPFMSLTCFVSFMLSCVLIHLVSHDETQKCEMNVVKLHRFIQVMPKETSFENITI